MDSIRVPTIMNTPKISPIITIYLAKQVLVQVRKLAKIVSLFALSATLVFQTIVPKAQSQTINDLGDLLSPVTNAIPEIYEVEDFPNTFPVSQAAPRWKIKVPMTAYNSEPGQTDDTPCIAARGYNLCEANEENVVAANFVPIGTKIKVPELYGDKEFTVVDRMNKRYTHKVDFWMKSKADAKKFGVKYATVEIY